jgi:hypothetical protein
VGTAASRGGGAAAALQERHFVAVEVTREVTAVQIGTGFGGRSAAPRGRLACAALQPLTLPV